MVCLVEWAAWVEWVEWECNPTLKQKFKKGSFYCPFFLLRCYKIKICQKDIVENHSKTHSASKKPKLSLKEKRKQKKEKTKKS